MWLYCRDWYKNLPKDEKQRLVEYRKKYYNMRKKTHFYNYKKLLFQKIMSLEEKCLKL